MKLHYQSPRYLAPQYCFTENKEQDTILVTHISDGVSIERMNIPKDIFVAMLESLYSQHLYELRKNSHNQGKESQGEAGIEQTPKKL